MTRQNKRAFRRMGMSCPLYAAHNEGQAAAMWPRAMPPRLRRNPYPPGKRHDVWNDAFNSADPMGDHHGRNV